MSTVADAQRVLTRLEGKWNELWQLQIEHDWRPEDATVRSSTPGSRMLHTGTPTELQSHYLVLQRALRDAWRVAGGTWLDDSSTATVHPAALERITRQLHGRLDGRTDDSAERAAQILVDAWGQLPDGVRGEAKGGGQRCAYCTEPASQGRPTCPKCRHLNPDDVEVCMADGCWRRVKKGERTCARCRKRRSRLKGVA